MYGPRPTVCGVRTIQNTGVFWQAAFQTPRPHSLFLITLRRQNFNHAPRQYRQLRRLIFWAASEIWAKQVF